MDFPNPTTLPHKRLDDKDDIIFSVGRVDLGRDEFASNFKGRSLVSSLQECKKRRNLDSNICSSQSNDTTNRSEMNVDVLATTIEPLKISSNTSISELEKQSSIQLLPSLTSDINKRARQTEIAAIVSQASVIGFRMGTSNLEGKPSSQNRRRHQRRNSVVYRSIPDAPT